MPLASFSPEDVFLSHAQAMKDRYVDSVLPEPAGVPMDDQALVALLGTGFERRNFDQRGLVISTPRNYLAGVKIGFVDDAPDIALKGTAKTRMNDTERTALAQGVAELILPVDQHFRQLTGLDPSVRTEPVITLTAGKFSDKDGGSSRKHFDYRAQRPVISYKNYFLGEPEFGSVYYPGPYRLPGRWSYLSAALAMGGPEPAPKNLTPRAERQHGVIAKAKTVNIEPWNAYHSGPTDTHARGKTRGILVVSYDLRDTLPKTDK